MNAKKPMKRAYSFSHLNVTSPETVLPPLKSCMFFVSLSTASLISRYFARPIFFAIMLIALSRSIPILSIMLGNACLYALLSVRFLGLFALVSVYPEIGRAHV